MTTALPKRVICQEFQLFWWNVRSSVWIRHGTTKSFDHRTNHKMTRNKHQITSHSPGKTWCIIFLRILSIAYHFSFCVMNCVRSSAIERPTDTLRRDASSVRFYGFALGFLVFSRPLRGAVFSPVYANIKQQYSVIQNKAANSRVSQSEHQTYFLHVSSKWN
jgi:hypothetical protein